MKKEIDLYISGYILAVINILRSQNLQNNSSLHRPLTASLELYMDFIDLV